MNRVRIKFLAVAFALLLILGTFGLAVPRINISAQEIGAGSCGVVSPVCKGGVMFHYSGWNTVDYVLLHFERDLPADTGIYFVVKDSQGNTIAMNSITLGSSLPAGQDVRIDISFNTNSMDHVEVVVKTPPNKMDSSGAISLSVSELGHGVMKRGLHYPIVITERSGRDLYEYPVKIVGTGDPGDTLYFLDSNGNPLYYWYYHDASTDQIVIFVKVPFIPANGQVTIFLHYGGDNPYRGYFSGDNTFLFFDDFSGPTLTDKWNINGNVQLANGIVTLSDNQWIWTKDTFPDSFIIDFRANINGNPGFMWYIDPSSGWGYINDINYFSYPNRGHLWQFNVNTGAWKDQNQEGTARYTLRSYTYFEIQVPGRQGSQTTETKVYQFTDWLNLQEKNSYTVTVVNGGNIGFEQFESGWGSPESSYDWVLVRPYVNPEPAISTPGYYYDIDFEPCPSTETSPTALPQASPAASLFNKPLRAPVTLPEMEPLNVGREPDLRVVTESPVYSADGETIIVINEARQGKKK